MKDKVISWIKKEIVLFIAGLAAVISMFYVMPSADYFSYIDTRVLALLFCLMAVVAGLQKNNVFKILSRRMLKGVKTIRSMCYILVILCFFSSMWITNDVALITFVPFSILLLELTEKEEYLIYVIVMQTIAANLGSMLTPVGNPQNLYLYSYYRLDGMEFLRITLPLVTASFFIISIISLLVKGENIIISEEMEERINPGKLTRQIRLQITAYVFLFLICMGTVLHYIDYRITLAIVILVIAFLDKSIFQKVDYSLLFTFICFFIFVGNLSNMTLIRLFLSKLIQTRELTVSILLSQIISNVPAAVLLSNFTKDAESLIIGADIGGLGTVIASLASLISYRFYCRTHQSKPMKYLGIFTVVNIGMLLLLFLFEFTAKFSISPADFLTAAH